jgi:hypothetical protein
MKKITWKMAPSLYRMKWRATLCLTAVILAVLPITHANAESLVVVVDPAANIIPSETYTSIPGGNPQLGTAYPPQNIVHASKNYVVFAKVTDNGTPKNCLSTPNEMAPKEYWCWIDPTSKITIKIGDWDGCAVATCPYMAYDQNGHAVTPATSIQTMAVYGIVFLYAKDELKAGDFGAIASLAVSCPPNRWIMDGSGQLICMP